MQPKIAEQHEMQEKRVAAANASTYEVHIVSRAFAKQYQLVNVSSRNSMPARSSVAPPEPSPDGPSDKQICLYISEMCSELRRLARRPRFRTVNYLLDMARLESERMGKDLPD